MSLNWAFNFIGIIMELLSILVIGYLVYNWIEEKIYGYYDGND